MSLVPYEPFVSSEPLDVTTPLLVTMAFMVAALLVNKEPQEEPVIQLDAAAQTVPSPEDIPLRRQKSVKIHPLDEHILAILKASGRPMTVREITRMLPGSVKSDVNSRLYTLLGQKTVMRMPTEKAPLWWC